MMHLHFLHGFMGLPLDWGPVALDLKSRLADRQVQFHMHNLWKDLERLPEPSLKNWALQFAQKLPPERNILVGYSMGGRLAMHFPVWEQKKIAGMCLIASHPGLETEGEKVVRAKQDQLWAEKFETLPWDDVIKEWNSQKIFVYDRIRPPRKEADFSRPLLASALRNWSLSKQENIVPRLKEFQFPIYYFHGERDEKFADVAKLLKIRVPAIDVKAVPGGHSCHFSSAPELGLALKSFLNRFPW